MAFYVKQTKFIQIAHMYVTHKNIPTKDIRDKVLDKPNSLTSLEENLYCLPYGNVTQIIKGTSAFKKKGREGIFRGREKF